jgi:tRNA nucleotidyltransferase (CCA-adding enzyme)
MTIEIIKKKFTRPLKKPYVPGAELKVLMDCLNAEGARVIVVGGSVRDHLMGKVAPDTDIEVYGLSLELLEKVLRKNFYVQAVGKSFGIFKVVIGSDGNKKTFDLAMPRTENKEGIGHKGFIVNPDPRLDFVSASKRRDFSINAMGIDVQDQLLLDPHGGEEDLKKKRLRHVSAAFVEDPLRVLRAAQFAARLEFDLDEETILLCKSLKHELLTLSSERIYEEMKKLFRAEKPSLGLTVLRETEALVLFPELEALIDCPQEKEWHPEGDVWIHSLMVLDQAARLVKNSELSESEKLTVLVAALCHDLGKPITTIVKDGRIKSPGHEQAGIEPCKSLLARMAFPKKWQETIVSLVAEHLKPFQLYAKRSEVSDAALRRLASRVDVKLLLYVSQADFLGRTTKDALEGHDPSAQWLKDRLKEVLGGEERLKALLLGRHLLALGEKPGPTFSRILHAAFEAQLDGHFANEEQGILWLKKYLKDNNK